MHVHGTMHNFFKYDKTKKDVFTNVPDSRFSISDFQNQLKFVNTHQIDVKQLSSSAINTPKQNAPKANVMFQ